MKLSTQLLLAVGLAFGQTASGASAPELIAQGDALDARLKTAEALAVYLEAETITPEDPKLLIKIAKQYGESMVDKKTDASRLAAGNQALDYARRALAQAPDMADAHLAVAICYGRLLDYLPAKEKVEYSRQIKVHADKAAALDPRSDYALHMQGRWYRAVADTGVLLRGIVKVVYGGLPKASHEDAAKAFEKAAAINPDRVAHHIELGLTYVALKKPDKARASLERGLALPARERDDADTQARGRQALKALK